MKCMGWPKLSEVEGHGAGAGTQMPRIFCAERHMREHQRIHDYTIDSEHRCISSMIFRTTITSSGWLSQFAIVSDG